MPSMTEILIQYNTNNHLLMDWKIPAPAADLILWHEGYKASTGPSSKLFNEAEWEKYTDSIINFANTNNYKMLEFKSFSATTSQRSLSTGLTGSTDSFKKPSTHSKLALTLATRATQIRSTTPKSFNQWLKHWRKLKPKSL